MKTEDKKNPTLKVTNYSWTNPVVQREYMNGRTSVSNNSNQR